MTAARPSRRVAAGAVVAAALALLAWWFAPRPAPVVAAPDPPAAPAPVPLRLPGVALGLPADGDDTPAPEGASEAGLTCGFDTLGVPPGTDASAVHADLVFPRSDGPALRWAIPVDRAPGGVLLRTPDVQVEPGIPLAHLDDGDRRSWLRALAHHGAPVLELRVDGVGMIHARPTGCPTQGPQAPATVSGTVVGAQLGPTEVWTCNGVVPVDADGGFFAEIPSDAACSLRAVRHDGTVQVTGTARVVTVRPGDERVVQLRLPASRQHAPELGVVQRPDGTLALQARPTMTQGWHPDDGAPVELLDGATLLAIDGEAVDGMNRLDVEALLQGAEGDRFVLEVAPHVIPGWDPYAVADAWNGIDAPVVVEVAAGTRRPHPDRRPLDDVPLDELRALLTPP